MITPRQSGSSLLAEDGKTVAAKPTHFIRVYPIGNHQETVYQEAFTGTDLAAEHRLSKVWTERTPPDGSRFRATLRRNGDRFICMRIGHA